MRSTNTRSNPTTPKTFCKWGPILLKGMKDAPGLQDVNSDQQNGGRDELLTYDRATAAKLGLTVQQPRFRAL